MTDNPFTQALGKDIDTLPQPIREHFGMEEGTRHYQGTMTRIWRRPGLRGLLATPVLRLAAAADILFAETGTDVGFSLRHRVAEDEGHSTMVWSRQFRFPKVTRRFDAIMRYDKDRECIVDWLGGKGGMEVELHAQLIEQGIEIESGKQWLRIGRANLPVPSWIAGKATIREWMDEEEQQRIEVVVSNPILGEFFGYEGSFSLVDEAEEDSEQAPELPVPAPGVVVPVMRWLLLAAVAILGTVLVSQSFVWSNSALLEDVGVAVGMGSGVAWIAFGVALLNADPKVPAVTWADLCLRTMSVGMAILSVIFAINSLQSLGVVSTRLPAIVYALVVATADIAMATYFVRGAIRKGLRGRTALALWVFVLNGICALVIAGSRALTS